MVNPQRFPQFQWMKPTTFAVVRLLVCCWQALRYRDYRSSTIGNGPSAPPPRSVQSQPDARGQPISTRESASPAECLDNLVLAGITPAFLDRSSLDVGDKCRFTTASTGCFFYPWIASACSTSTILSSKHRTTAAMDEGSSTCLLTS